MTHKRLSLTLGSVPLLVLLQAPPALAQLASALGGATPKQPALLSAHSQPTAPNGSSGFLGGSDACAAPQFIGTGDVLGMAFDATAATTGPEHQSESLCFSFGTSGIDHDVWFRWTSAGGGVANATLCGGTTGDTKAGVYADTGGCPAGSALGCNDDSCGLQSMLSWHATAGTDYVLQIGSFPGSVPTSGTFDVTEQSSPPCGQYDDGASENSLGLVGPGEMAWMHFWDCAGHVDLVLTAYGSAVAPGSITNGAGSQIALYAGGDANSGPVGATLLASITTTVVNGNTDILNPFPIAGNLSGGGWALASADQIGGEFPGALDSDSSGPEAWVVGSSSGPGSLDLTNLGNNSLPPLQLQAIGFGGRWLLRIDGPPGGHDIGITGCFGDGSGTACPCGNSSASGGCANSTGDGCVLTAQADHGGTLNAANAIPTQPGLFFQGDNHVGGGNGIAFGDGLRCCGSNVVRLGVAVPDSTGDASIDDAQNRGGASPGETKCYQYWYRNPGGTPCGAGFNLSNSVTITW